MTVRSLTVGQLIDEAWCGVMVSPAMATGLVRERLGLMMVRYRTHAGLTQRELAQRLDVSPGTVAMWEAGDRWPDDRNLVALIEECSLNPSELFGTHPVYRGRRRAAGGE